MAVGRLSGSWVTHTLATWPEGVARRDLLEVFAAELVTARSHRGAKGRVAMRLYRTLEKLQRRGLVEVEEGLVRLTARAQREDDSTRASVPPPLTAPIQRALFAALRTEDRAGSVAEETFRARVVFVGLAMGEGWSLLQIAHILGARPAWVAQVAVGIR